MSATVDSTISLPADEEHTGIQLTVVGVLIVGLIVFFFLLRFLFTTFATDELLSLGPFLSCMGSIPLTLGLVYLAETGLKRIWPSGRRIEIDTHRITAREQERPLFSINRQQNYSTIQWYFQMGGFPRGGRERRINKRWFCVAMQLQQDEDRLIVHTFVPPRKAKRWTGESSDFQRIFPADVYDTSLRGRIGPPSRPNISTEVLRDKHGRFWLAESRRWEEGFELSANNFEKLLQLITP